MDREIKFRVWDNFYKKFCPINIDCYTITFQGDIWLISCSEYYDKTCWPFARLDSDRFKMLQFTGLKDRNGREIYEEDILIEKCDGYNNLFIVEFNKNGFYCLKSPNYKYRKNEYDSPLFDYCYISKNKVKLKIIGNIFENSELLNSKIS